MIEHEYGAMRIVCDLTGERFSEDYSEDYFYRMIEDAKEAGWIIRPEGGEWRHYSPKTRGAAAEFEPVIGVD